MPCLVKRTNGIIDKVYLPDGKTESKTYKDLLQAAENIPSEMQSYVLMSIKPYVGKFIKNTEDASEVALGMYLNLHTKKFKDYFGDWEKARQDFNEGLYPSLQESLTANNVSHGVNEIGEPHVLYHGSPDKTITSFDRTKLGTNVDAKSTSYGFYFTQSKRSAEMYSNWKNPLDKTGVVYPVFLKIQNPSYGREIDTIREGDKVIKTTDQNRVEQIELGINRGADGIILGEDALSKDIIVVFNPNQIKSVYNSGEFQQSTSEIYRSIKTTRTANLLSYVNKSVQVLNLRIKDAKKQRDKALNDKELSFKEKTEKQKYYNALIQKTLEQIKVLKEKNNVDYVALLAQTDLEMARVILSSDKTTMSELSIARKAVDAWKNILSILGLNSLEDITEESLRKDIRDIKSDAQDLDINLTELANKLLIKHSQDAKSAKPLTEKDLDPKKGIRDVNWITATTRDISKTGVGLVNYLAKLINEANLKIDKEHHQNNRKIDGEYKLVQNHPEIKKNGFTIFFKEQATRLGIKTLGLRGPYAQSYYDASRLQYKKLKTLVQEAGSDKEKVKAAYVEHNVWLKKNTTLFNSVPFIEESKYSDQDRLKVIDEMKSQGFEGREINDIIKKSQELYGKYLEGSERFKINLEFDIDNGNVEVPAGKTREEFVAAESKRWDEEHNPVKYIEQQEKYNLGETRAYKGSYYTVKVPVKEIDGKDSGHYDKEFAKIAADPKLFRFYQFFRDFINEQLGYLPEEEIDDLQSNFLPVITSKIAREYGLTNLKETANGIGDWFLKHLTSVDIDPNQKVDPITGKVIHDFSPRFIDENVAVEERSKDMVTMMKMFSDMALVYKHKLQVQDYVNTVNDIIQNADKTQMVNSSTGEVKVESRSPKNLQNMVESGVLNSFYGVKPNEEDLSGKRKFFNAAELLTMGLYKSESYHKAKALEESIKTINKDLESTVLTEAERSAREKELLKLKKDYSALGGRQFSFTKSADSLVNLTRLTALGFQPFSAFRNIAVGKTNNIIHAIGGEDFNKTELAKANKIISASVAKYVSWGGVNSEKAEKILRYMLDTGVVEGEDSMFRDGVLDKNTSLESIKRSVPSPFSMMQSTDFHMKSETAVASALHLKVKTASGEEVPFWETLTKELNYDQDKYGEWSPENNKGLTFEEFYNKEMLKIGQLSKKLHGFSGSRASLMGKDTVWGRLLFVFKTWLPETFATRFESKRYDEFLDREVQGYYRTIFNTFQEKGLGGFSALFKAAFEDQLDGLSDAERLERANLRKMFAEMVAIITLSIIGMMFKSMVSGMDDDEDKKRYMLLANQLILLNRDMTYYANLNSFGDLTRDVVPVIRTLENFQAAGKAVSYHFTGVEHDDGTEMYDSERTLLKVSKALPVFNNINRIKYYEEEMTEVR